MFHYGHMLNRILKDFIVRYKTMSGFYVPFIFGFDTHGLPIEVNVEKKLATTLENRTLSSKISRYK